MTTDVATNKEVKQCREAAGVSQDALAFRLGISRQSYISFEKLGRPLPRSITTAHALAAIAALEREA